MKLINAMLKDKRNTITSIIYFGFFLFLYLYLDQLNGGYLLMIEQYSLMLVIVNMILNLAMSAVSSYMMILSGSLLKISGKEGKGTFFSGIAVVFGMLTYCCNPCVIAFFATIGITLSIAVLPLAGLPYKLISMLILIAGYLWLRHELRHATCKVVQ